MSPSRSTRIAVVGDIHNHWNAQDHLALASLNVDLVLFVGDFGNEAVDVVRQIATLALPIATTFGNHDAWYTATPWGRKRCPYDRTQEDWVKQQMALLKEADTGYCHRDFDTVSVVGGRPFSWGGPEWRFKDFYGEWFGVHSFEESAQRMQDAANAAAHDTLIFLSHNGPTGLGKEPEDTCGKDWSPIGGDYGDPDLAAAIAAVKASGKLVPLVTFGHMHHSLRHTKEVQRTRLCLENGTVYLNAACVPRILDTETGEQRNFSVVTLQDHLVTEVNLVWVNADLTIASTECLHTAAHGETHAAVTLSR
jgi:uncharacterized protein (TIGR04168 family)